MASRLPPAINGLLCLGVVGAAHGVRGAMKVKTFTEQPLDLAAYGPLTDATGERVFVIASCTADKLGARITLEGVTTRAAAEALRGVAFYVSRDRLPQLDAEDDFYHADLIGLEAVTPDGIRLGTVVGCHNFGAGDVLEIDDRFFAFTKAVVSEVNLAEGRLTLIPPSEQEAQAERDAFSDAFSDGLSPKEAL